MLHTLRLSCKPLKSGKKSKSNRLSPRVVFQFLQRWTFRVAPFLTSSCVVPGFYWQLPPCMSSRRRSPNTVLRDVAARQRHVEGSPTFSNSSFRSRVRYIMDVLIAAFTRSCSTLRPQAHENSDPTFIFILTAHFLFLLLRACLLTSASLHWGVGGGCARYFAVLPDFESLNMDHLLQTSHCCGHHYLANPILVIVSHHIMIYLRAT